MKRRLLSILLLICMTLTLFPVPAFAEGEDLEEAPVCVCTEACTEGAVNYACSVCGDEGAQACTCAEEVIVVNAVADTDNAGDTDDAGDTDGADDADDANGTNDADIAAYSTFVYAAAAPAAQEAVTPVLTPPTIEGTFYALDEYKVLKAAGLTGGTATVNGEKIEGKFALDEDELLYGYPAGDGVGLRAGKLERTVIFTPEDTVKYTTATCKVNVDVLPLKVIRVFSITNVIANKPVGTEFAELGLPVDIEFEAGRDDGSGTRSCPGDVIWDKSNYDKNSPNEQTITGMLDLSWWKEYIEQPTTSLTTSIKVKLKYEPVAPTIVTAPVFQWTKGEFALGGNQIFVGDYLELGTTQKAGEADETAVLSGGEAMLDGTAIDGTFTLKKPQQSFDGEGQYDVTVVFTPKDQDRYAVTECTIKIDAIKRTVARIEPCQDITGEPVGTAFDDLGLPFVNLYTEDGAVYPCGVTWDKTTYDPYSIEEQTITGTPNLNAYARIIKQPESEIKAEVKIKLQKTSDTIEIRYHMYNPDGDVEYKTDGTSAILTDYTTALEDYELRGLGTIFQALQAAGKFTDLDVAGNELDGWYEERDINDYSFRKKVTDTSQLAGKQVVNLYGKINPKTIMVTLDPCGGTLTAGESHVECKYGVWYGDLPTPARHGYTFDGWYTAEAGGSEISKQVKVMETTDHTIYAHWKQAAGHSPVRAMNSETLKTPADCEHDAVYYMSCSCGVISTSETFTAENTALGHDYVNCSSNGDGTHTGVCSRDASTGTEPCSGGFAYCMEKATCTKCKTEYGELGGHIYGTEWKNDNTYHWHACSGCNGVDSKVLHADNDNDHRCDACYHRLSTCADENNDHKCDVCSKQLSECADDNKDHLCDTCSKKLTDHTGGTATCTKKAVCTFCGKEYGELASHSYTAENTDAKYLKTAATCTAKAVYYKSCAVCGLSSKGAAEEATFEAGNILGHDYGGWTSNGDGTHTGKCAHDASHTKTEACTGGTATCIKKAVCTFCGKEYDELASHSFTAENTDAKYLKTAASCTAKAVYYKSCAVCGAAGTGTFEYGEKNPDNHSGTGGWSITASTHEQKWSCCGKVTVSAEGHSFGEWVVTKSPTYSQRGIRTHTCELCGYAESEYIPATGGGKTPRTGDDSALGLWSLLMCTSLTGALSLTALGLKRRTKKEQ